MATVVFEDSAFGGRIDAGGEALATEFGQPFVFSGEIEDRVHVGGHGLVLHSSGNGRVEQFPVQKIEVRYPEHAARDLKGTYPFVGYYFEALAPYVFGGAEDYGGGREGYFGMVAVHAAQLQRPLAVETHGVPRRPEQVAAGFGEVASLDAGPVHGGEPGLIAVELLPDELFRVFGVGQKGADLG